MRTRVVAAVVVGASLAAAVAAAAGGSAGARLTGPGGLGRLPAAWHSPCRLEPAGAPLPAARVDVRRGIAYSAGERLDLYLPANGKVARPAVVVVHGGGWRYGNRGGMATTAMALARAGFVVAAPDYRLAAPGVPSYPAAVDDVRAAIGFVRRDAAALGVDGRRIGALGSSAGGHLAMLAATSAVGPCTTGVRVAAVVTWSAPLDLPAIAGCADRDCTLARLTAGFVGCDLSRCPGRWRVASPVDAVSRDDPPALVVTSTAEFVPAAQAARMAAALRAASVPAWLLRYPGHRHASAYRDDAIGPSIRFLAAVLSGR